jgi:hypothetical protein
MMFALICPADDAEIDASDELNAGFTRAGAIGLLDSLREKRAWPYEILDNQPTAELARLYREEAVPAAQLHGDAIRTVFGSDTHSASKFGTVVPALIVYDIELRPAAVYPHRTHGNGEPRPIIPYLEGLFDEP